ncbi:Hypothetical protein R9X50_00505000 [Acrodontium crateriforme]|uniref:Uncharacterized protein n=1 Tax=Acrodontium crateriforme TaxID=150365 RepID=A0AAQ3M792_9PEZI|nr:Hypothetical protein R9X50_00505000 [Acrodontium crateriforme]
MAFFNPSSTSFSNLKHKTVVVSGGATGIGAATVTLLAQQGANVVIGDVNTRAAQTLIEHLDNPHHGKVLFQSCDVAKYADVVSLFRFAFEKFAIVHHAISCAGIFERGDWFDEALTRDSVGDDEGNLSVMDINVRGTMWFSRVAVVYLRDGRDENMVDDRSLTLMSSVNAFRESPKLFCYQTSKHAVHGFMRASRKPLWDRHRIRINCVCPGMTETPMTAGMVEKFQVGGLHWQTSEIVANNILGILVRSERTDDGSDEKGPDDWRPMVGKAIYIEGGDAWEFEDSLIASQSAWLGEEANRRMDENTEAVKRGALTSNN